MSLQFKNVNKKYKLKNKLSIIRNIRIVKMLRLEPSPHYLNKFLQSHQQQNDYFLIQQKGIKIVQQLINQIVFTTFQKSESFLIILLRKVLIELINRKLSVVLLEEIFQLVKQYEAQIKHFKQHFFQLQKLMFENQNILDPSLDKMEENSLSLLNCSLINLPPLQSTPEFEDNFYLSPSNQRNAKSLVVDIDCYSQDSKHNFISRYDDKYFCSEYLTTSQDEKQFTSRSTVIKQLKEQMQNKLKIEPHVSAFSFGIKQKNMAIDFQQELLEWKRTKHSIVQQCSLQGALCPQDLDETNFMEKMKQNHYRQKIKSVIVKKRLSTKHIVT